ncbi:hypothetical protein B0H10DRAFT_1913010 [Mycena sp. CBHHK59/15]|nr:hypothetical protein B0H10DRAFT_1913010 [Mycena sp. CBHHK59/15]
MFSRAHPDDTVLPHVVDADESRDFFQQILRVSILDVLRKFEQWCCTQDEETKERNDVASVCKQIVLLVLEGLRMSLSVCGLPPRPHPPSAATARASSMISSGPRPRPSSNFLLYLFFLHFHLKRSLTLLQIHTHPSQSCFMSSVDLHTHASFQRMLPESFAVVCAPKSDPSFGIFCLTDPPGLQTVLQCTEKQAFHPHPDVQIYTDADKGHVHMREAALEIVDLR